FALRGIGRCAQSGEARDLREAAGHEFARNGAACRLGPEAKARGSCNAQSALLPDVPGSACPCAARNDRRATNGPWLVFAGLAAVSVGLELAARSGAERLDAHRSRYRNALAGYDYVDHRTARHRALRRPGDNRDY